MSELIGQTILHYRILEQVGQGGMGIVYKAEDTKLERTVALKFLSLTSIGDEEKKRFKREAKAAASLNHPNIATVFAIDEVDDQTFIAMEFIEGTPLNPSLARGDIGGSKPLPLDKAIDYATQIAAGLQAAHEKGIVHRDIKSANIMVTDKGQIKIMDFGLAKLAHRSKMTQLGTTLGTAAYMSPEQARGESVDHRSDIWSLGVVLYEMISGQMPFKGDYEQAVIYSIQNEEPEPLTAVRSGLPIALDGIIAKALAKDPATRYQHVDELPADLKGLDTATLSKSRVGTKAGISAPSNKGRNAALPWIVSAVMTVIAAAALWYGLSTGSNTVPTTVGLKRFTMPLSPADEAGGLFAVSPDGRAVVFRGQSGEIAQLYYRSLESDEAEPLPGTENGFAPFFSPDGMWVGFLTREALWKVRADGGAPTKICNTGFAWHASWGDNGQIIFDQPISEMNWQLRHVSADGGQPEPLHFAEPDTHILAMWPKFLPGSRAILYEASTVRGNPDNSSILLHNLETGKTQTVIQTGANPFYASTGHIIYALSGNLMAVPFDLESLTVRGNPVVVAKDILFDPDNLAYRYGFSQEGSLFYVKSVQEGGNNLVWVDRNGIEIEVPAASHLYWDPRVSPDGRHVAMNARDAGNDIWVYDLDRGSLSRLTHDPGEDETAFWSPDGRWIAFSSSRAGQPRSIFKTLSDGSGGEELLWTGDNHMHVDFWSADGRSMILTDTSPTTLQDLWILNLEGEPTAQPLW